MSSRDRRPQPYADESDDTLGFDDVFTALAAARRREVINELAQRPEGIATVDELADRLTDRERGVLEEPPTNHRERVTAALYHNHLPHLDELGVVEFDRRSGSVRFRGNAAVEEWLEHASALTLPGRSQR